ncbi:MAG: hypothetical protein OSA81_13510 [Longimicrobiales bacterium]|nr:hypothetical protein [Longimicrobiales bacterium]
MHTRVRIGLWFVVFLALSAFGIGAGGEVRADQATEAEAPENPGWTSSLSLSIEARHQSAVGSVQSTLATRETNEVDTTPLVPNARLDSSLFGISVPIGLEVSAPVIEGLPGDARPFMEVSYQLVPSSDRVFLQEGNPGPVAVPASLISQGLGFKFETDISHQWSASLGVSFQLPTDEYSVRFRPSLDYFGQAMKFNSQVVGLPVDAAGAATSIPLSLNMASTGTYHYLGPRVSFEVDAGRRGPLRFVMFLDLAGYLLVGSGAVQGSAGAGSAEGPQTANFRYTPGLFTFQGGMGTRVVWDPVRDGR